MAFKIAMAANLGPQQMACMISTIIKAEHFFAHKRLPVSGLENSCNATILLQGGSQKVVLGRETIGDSSLSLLKYNIAKAISDICHFFTTEKNLQNSAKTLQLKSL